MRGVEIQNEDGGGTRRKARGKRGDGEKANTGREYFKTDFKRLYGCLFKPTTTA